MLCSVLDLPYDILNASFDGRFRRGPEFFNFNDYKYYIDAFNPVSLNFYGLTKLASESGDFISHRPDRNYYQTPYNCLSYNSSSEIKRLNISNWKDFLEFEMPLDLLSNLSRLDTIYIPGPRNRTAFQVSFQAVMWSCSMCSHF